MGWLNATADVRTADRTGGGGRPPAVMVAKLRRRSARQRLGGLSAIAAEPIDDRGSRKGESAVAAGDGGSVAEVA
jgi:hypothetical protein